MLTIKLTELLAEKEKAYQQGRAEMSDELLCMDSNKAKFYELKEEIIEAIEVEDFDKLVYEHLNRTNNHDT